jgi:hypothetical protein
MDTGNAPPSSFEGLQFYKAEFASAHSTKVCTRCKQSIASDYFEAGGQIVCRTCRDQLTGAVRDRWVFLRALLYGGLVGAAGTLVWSLIIHFTGYELGLIAIIVGVGVGLAVRKGSRGRGGWKYQTLAMVLTYVSITTSYVPIVFKGFVEGIKKNEAATAVKESTAPSAAENSVEPTKLTTTPGRDGKKPSMPLPIAIVAFVGVIWGLALAAPFLAGASNIMGIIIIGIGLYEAWKFNKRVIVNGPFKLVPEPAPAAEPSAAGTP